MELPHSVLGAWIICSVVVLILLLVLVLERMSPRRLSPRIWQCGLAAAAIGLVPALIELVLYYVWRNPLPPTIRRVLAVLASMGLIAVMVRLAVLWWYMRSGRLSWWKEHP